jgi:hypothetical protein
MEPPKLVIGNAELIPGSATTLSVIVTPEAGRVTALNLRLSVLGPENAPPLTPRFSLGADARGGEIVTDETDPWHVNLAGPRESAGRVELLKITLHLGESAPEGAQYRVVAEEAESVDESGLATDVTDWVSPGTVTIDRCVDLQQGDADGNGSLTIGDVTRILRIAVGLTQPTSDCARAAADVDCNGHIQIADAILILRKVVLNEALSTCSALM